MSQSKVRFGVRYSDAPKVLVLCLPWHASVVVSRRVLTFFSKATMLYTCALSTTTSTLFSAFSTFSIRHDTTHRALLYFFRMPLIAASRRLFLYLTLTDLPVPAVVLACIRKRVVGGSRSGAISGVIEGLSGIIFGDDDSDRSVSDIDEAVIASECTC